MIPTHRRWLFTMPIKWISVVWVVGMLVLLFAIGNEDQSISYLQYHQGQVRFEYRSQAFTLWKLMVVAFTVFFWVYASRWNAYDIHLLWQNSVQTVKWSKGLVVLEGSGVFAIVTLLLYCFVELMYPYPIDWMEVLELLFFGALFVLHYNMLCFVLERLIPHLFGLFVPLLGYVVVLLVGDGSTYDTKEQTAGNVIALVLPDIIVMEQGYQLVFGGWIMLSIIVLLAICGRILIANQDPIS